MQGLVFVFALVAASVPISTAELGIDTWGAVNKPSQWQCLKSHSFNFASFRIYQSIVDVNAVVTIKQAQAAGISKIEGWIVPTRSGCGDAECAAEIVDEAVTNLQKNNVTIIKQIWIDVDDYIPLDQTEPSKNVAFLSSIIKELKARNYSAGIRT